MDYKEKYEMALEGIQEILGSGEDSIKMSRLQLRLQGIFPELKESEDERIRKEMISWLKGFIGEEEGCGYTEDEIKERIAWLEKQGENISLPKFTFDDVLALQCVMETTKKVQEDKELYEQLQSLHDRLHDAYWLEKQGEQKPAVIIPKFRVGDEIKTANEESLTITKIDGKGYWSGDLFICDFDEECLWDLGEKNQKHFELKAGHWYICHRAYCCRADHLTVKEGERFMCEKDGVVKGFIVKEPEKYFKEVCAPAPMEGEQKPAWSEEDEAKLKSILFHIEDVENKDVIDWLKSLKERYTWKPSDEQMNALNYVVNLMASSERPTENDLYYNILKSLRQQLMKLKG